MSEPKYFFITEQVRKAHESKSVDGQKRNRTDRCTTKSVCAAADNAEKESKATVIGDECPTECPTPSQTTIIPPSQAHLDVSEQASIDQKRQIKAEQAISTGNPIKKTETREARRKDVKKAASVSHDSRRSGCSPSPSSGGAVCTTKVKGAVDEAGSEGKYFGSTMATKRKLLAPAFPARFDADGVASCAKRHKLTLEPNVSSRKLCAMKGLKPFESATTRMSYRAHAPSSSRESISTTPKRTTKELWTLAETVDLGRPVTRQSSLKIRQPLEESIEELVQSRISPLAEEPITKSPLAGRPTRLLTKQPAEQSVYPSICLSSDYPLNSPAKAQDKQRFGKSTKSSIGSIPSDQICSKNLTMSPVTVVFDYKPMDYTSPFVATPPRESPFHETLKPKLRRPNTKYLGVDGGLVTALQSLEITEGDPCPLFRKWPFEIREMVYKNLLFAGCIEHPDKLVNDKLKTFVRKESDRSFSHLGIDSTILQTCRKIHDEALPVLYAHNRFMFDDPVAIEVFRQKGLVKVLSSQHRFLKVPSFNLLPNEQGRLTAIRKLTLVLTNEPSQRHHGFLAGQTLPPRHTILREWQNFLQENRLTNEGDGCEVADFKSLDDLTLDFLNWDLGPDDIVVHRPFVERLRTPKGLRRLEVKGVENQKSLDGLKAGLLQAGGKFVVTL